MTKNRTNSTRQSADTSLKGIRFQMCNKKKADVFLELHSNDIIEKLHIICKIKFSSCRYTITLNIEIIVWCEPGQRIYIIVICCEIVTRKH